MLCYAINDPRQVVRCLDTSQLMSIEIYANEL